MEGEDRVRLRGDRLKSPLRRANGMLSSCEKRSSDEAVMFVAAVVLVAADGLFSWKSATSTSPTTLSSTKVGSEKKDGDECIREICGNWKGDRLKL
jgi:hypothetical protein